ncbi:hypothetical protein EBR43_08930 [bacterium]|nr:hypothetical protein [bacterium]
MEKIYYCSVSGEPLPGSRVEALKMLGIPENMWTSISHSKVKRNKGIYFGEQGSGKLIIANKVYSDSMTNLDEALEKQEKTEKHLY